MKREPVQIFCSCLLILLFTYTAVSKLSDYPHFVRMLGESPLIHNGADIIAWLLPVTELVLVLLLVFPATRIAGLYGSFVLLILMTTYLCYMIWYTPHLPCNCGGVLTTMSWKQHVWFNVFFTGISIAGIYAQKDITFLRRQAKPKT